MALIQQTLHQFAPVQTMAQIRGSQSVRRGPQDRREAWNTILKNSILSNHILFRLPIDFY